MATKRKKKGKSKKWVVVLAVALFLILGFVAWYFLGSNGRVGRGGSGGSVLKNPVAELSDEQAVAQFNEGFVRYLLYAINADELHRPPLSSNRPKLEIIAGEVVFNAEVYKGAITVGSGDVGGEDVIIRTTKAEVVKMLRDRSYVVESFRNGASSIELVAPKTTLLAKGYIGLYEEITGEKVF